MSGAGSPTRKTIFLSVSAVCFVAIIIASRQVLLPFVLALVVSSGTAASPAR